MSDEDPGARWQRRDPVSRWLLWRTMQAALALLALDLGWVIATGAPRDGVAAVLAVVLAGLAISLALVLAGYEALDRA